MNDSPENPRKKRLDDVLLMIGGLEESIRVSYDLDDVIMARRLQQLKKTYYERLKKVIYGLPEEE